MNMMIMASIVLNAMATIGLSDRYPEMQGAVMGFLGCFVALSIIGAVMISSGRREIGAMLVIIGCIVFLPLGLIGVYGAKKVRDQVTREAFAKSAPGGGEIARGERRGRER